MNKLIEIEVLQLEVDVRRLLREGQQNEATKLVATCLEKNRQEQHVVNYILRLLQGKHKHLALSVKSISNDRRSNKATPEMRQEAHSLRLKGEKREVIRLHIKDKFGVGKDTVDRALRDMDGTEYFSDDD